ncbi:hypothetical protein ACJX0J_029722, partial [Zea mays]
SGRLVVVVVGLFWWDFTFNIHLFFPLGWYCADTVILPKFGLEGIDHDMVHILSLEYLCSIFLIYQDLMSICDVVKKGVSFTEFWIRYGKWD